MGFFDGWGTVADQLDALTPRLPGCRGLILWEKAKLINRFYGKFFLLRIRLGRLMGTGRRGCNPLYAASGGCTSTSDGETVAGHKR